MIRKNPIAFAARNCARNADILSAGPPISDRRFSRADWEVGGPADWKSAVPEGTMATVMLMHWPEVTREQYEAARKEVNWEGNAPKGGKFHTAWFGADGFRVLDLWDSREDFEAFVQTRLMPGVQKIGIEGSPRIEYAESIAIFAPNV